MPCRETGPGSPRQPDSTLQLLPYSDCCSSFQGGPAGDLEQIDAYLEALLREDHLLFQKAVINTVASDTGHCLPLEKEESISQN